MVTWQRSVPWRSWVLLSAILCCPIPTPAQTKETEETAADRIRVITYNVQFLPEPVSSKNERPQPSYRAKRIAEEAAGFDVVGLQETFHDTHRKEILDELGKVWDGKLVSFRSPTPEGFLTSGGCLLAARLPFAATGATVYVNFSKPQDYGLRADGFAAKGVVYARVLRDATTPDEFVDVFVTHLEARADHLRPRQYSELADFIRQQSSPRHPVLLMGDLNTRGSTEFRQDTQSQYSQLMRELQRARPDGQWIDVWPHLHGDALGGTTKQESADIGKRIDYLLISNPRPPQLQLKPISSEVELFRDPRVTALSDHNAVTAELEWRSR